MARQACTFTRLPPAPDVLIFATDWHPRALMRAQLIEDGFDVLATDDWLTARRCAAAPPGPKVVVVDLQHLQNPKGVLEVMRESLDPRRVVVLRASGTISRDELASYGFTYVSRPFMIKQIVAAVRALATASGGGQSAAR